MFPSDEFDMGGAQAPSDALTRLRAEIDVATKLQTAIEQMEEDLKAAKAELHDRKSRIIPEIMAEIQSDEFTFNGWKCKLKDIVAGSLPKDPDKRQAAIDWLVSHDGAGLIKTDLSIAFGRSQHNEAIDLASRLEKEGYAPDLSTGVHAMTLAKYARDRIENGEEIDIETLGLYTGKVAEFKPIKPKGGK